MAKIRKCGVVSNANKVWLEKNLTNYSTAEEAAEGLQKHLNDQAADTMFDAEIKVNMKNDVDTYIERNRETGTKEEEELLRGDGTAFLFNPDKAGNSDTISLSGLEDAISARWAAELTPFSAFMRVNILGKTPKGRAELFFKELDAPGSTANKEAKAAADAWKKVDKGMAEELAEAQRREFDITRKTSQPVQINPAAMAKAKWKGWYKDALRDYDVDAVKKLYPDMTVEEIFRREFDFIMQTLPKAETKTFRSQLTFKSNDHLFANQKKYGAIVGDYGAAFLTYKTQTVRLIAKTKRFGNNPERVLKSADSEGIINMSHNVHNGFTRIAGPDNWGRWEHTSGNADKIANNVWDVKASAASSLTRNVMGAAQLGGSIFAAVAGDLTTVFANGNFYGLSGLRVLRETFEQGKYTKQELQNFGNELSSLNDMGGATTRAGNVDAVKGFFGKFMSGQMRVNFTTWWTDRMRTAAVMGYNRLLGGSKGKGFNQLPRRLKAFFKDHGVTSRYVGIY